MRLAMGQRFSTTDCLRDSSRQYWTNVHIVYVSDLSSIIHDHPPRVNVESVYTSSDSIWGSDLSSIIKDNCQSSNIFLYVFSFVVIQLWLHTTCARWWKNIEILFLCFYIFILFYIISIIIIFLFVNNKIYIRYIMLF